MKNHGDLLGPVADAAKKAPAKKAPADKAPAKKAPADKAAAKKAPAKKAAAKTAAPDEAPAKKAAAKAPAKKAPAKKTGTKKAAAKRTADDGLLDAQTPPEELAEQGLDDVTPADVAKVAKKTPTKQTTPVKAADEAPAKKTAKKAAPRTAAEVANEEGPDLTTPVGTTAAGESALPNTDLQQPGTEPLMDPATVNAARSEAEIMQRAADPDKG